MVIDHKKKKITLIRIHPIVCVLSPAYSMPTKTNIKKSQGFQFHILESIVLRKM